MITYILGIILALFLGYLAILALLWLIARFLQFTIWVSDLVIAIKAKLSKPHTRSRSH